MLFSRLYRDALAGACLATAFLTSDASARVDNPELAHHLQIRQDNDDAPPNNQSIFVSPNGDLAFAFSVPERDNVGYYFSLRLAKSRSWAAIGLGSEDMAGALVLMMYLDEKGDNVTLSPRLAYGNYEPSSWDGFQWDFLSGTGVEDDHLVINARCTGGCRTWPARDTTGGHLDVAGSRQRAIYALGPSEEFRSDRADKGVKFHQEFGSFTLDMRRTQKSTLATSISDEPENVGTTLSFRRRGLSDAKSIAHGVLMSVAFIALMPLGAMFLSFGKLAAWHSVNQTVALAMVLAGFGVAVPLSFNYQRSRGFDSYHQIVGFVLVAFLLAQFTLGFLHHQQYKKTNMPSKYSQIHRWMGRVILFFGILNVFFGLNFSLNREYGRILAGIFLFIFLTTLLVHFMRYYLNRRRQPGAAPQGYGQQPWRSGPGPGPSGPSATPIYSNEAPPGYAAPGQNPINLQDMPPSPSPWRRHSAESKLDDDVNLGAAQRPREFA